MIPSSDELYRAKLFRVALDLYAERGNTASIGVPELAKRASLALGTFYRYFDGKDDLLDDLHQACRDDLDHRLFFAVQGERAGAERFAQLWDVMLQFGHEQPTSLRFLTHHVPSAPKRRPPGQWGHIPRALVDAMAALRKDREVKDQPPWLLAAIVWGAFQELARLSFEHGRRVRRDHSDAIGRCCWDAVRR